MKFDVNVLRYIEKDAWRVLVSVEMGMKNHELVPVELVNAISGLKHGGAYKHIRDLLKHKLVHHDNKKYDGYRLTPLGYDFLAIKAFVNRGAIAGVGRRIGVGKESDVFEVVTEEGETLALKLHRLGRTSFRAVKSKRDYLKSTNTHTNWLYLSRLAALKEHAFMKALGDNGFPVPTAVDVNRHAVLMSLVDGYPLTQVQKLGDPGKVYAQCVDQLVRLAECGLVHCDFNEFNVLVDSAQEITVIDFPQMVSSNHYNAEELFFRDLRCLHRFFLRRYNYRADLDPNGVRDPVFAEVAGGGVGHGAGAGVEKSLDVSLRASGFTSTAAKELEQYNEMQRKQAAAEAAEAAEVNSLGDGDEEEEGQRGSDDDDDDDDDEEQEGEGLEEAGGGLGGVGRRGFGYLSRGEEEVEEVVGSDDGDGDGGEGLDVEEVYGGYTRGKQSDEEGGVHRGYTVGTESDAAEEEDPEAVAAAVAAVARLYGGDAEDVAQEEEDGFDLATEESRDGVPKKPAPSVASVQRRRLARPAAGGVGDRDAASVGRSSMFSSRSRADQGNDPELVRARLKQQAAGTLRLLDYPTFFPIFFFPCLQHEAASTRPLFSSP